MVLLYSIVKLFCHADSLDLTFRGTDACYCNNFIILRQIKAGWMNDAILRPKILIVFQSYEDDGQLIIKDCVNEPRLQLKRSPL